MRAIADASYAGRVEDSLRFDLASGWQCRIFVLDDDLVRVLFLRNGELKEPRTWMVAPGGVDTPWEGRDRLDSSVFTRPDFSVAQSDREITIATRELALAVSLKPFRLRWKSAGRTFAEDRPTDSYQWSERSGVIRHYMA